ncbi:ATP-dependent RNA helicase RhlE [Spirosomataceae bacterium TFI 002]|nr:ATP-dependent RNA helicase RhlE [Spirosomataceae bacterium TFI 002]
MRFEKYRINSQLKENLAELGFHKTTDIQFRALPPILKGEDLLAIAQTGTGKTAAFAIPMIELATKNKLKEVFGVVLVPTHELALQIEKVFHSLAKKIPLKIMAIIGGDDQEPQILALQKGLDIIIATPGRLFDLKSQGHLSLNHLKMLVLDEADHMLAMGFIKDIRDLQRFIPENRQTLFFSATINPEIKKIAYSLVRNAVRIQVSPKNPVSKNVNHYLMNVEMDHKRFFLERFLKENEESKVLVFVRTKVRAERVKSAMDRVGIETRTIHSDKEQQDRKVIMRDFSNGTFKVMIATDVSSRGVDIPNVDFVINYDLPTEAENYVHRVGRTGRGRMKGKAISFCSQEENLQLEEIEEYLGKSIEEVSFSKQEYEETLLFSEDQKEISFKDIKKELMLEEIQASKRRKKKRKK